MPVIRIIKSVISVCLVAITQAVTQQQQHLRSVHIAHVYLRHIVRENDKARYFYIGFSSLQPISRVLSEIYLHSSTRYSRPRRRILQVFFALVICYTCSPLCGDGVIEEPMSIFNISAVQALDGLLDITELKTHHANTTLSCFHPTFSTIHLPLLR